MESPNGPPGSQTHKLAEDLDSINMAAVTGPKHAEARQWIVDVSHKGVKASHDQVAHWVQQIYEAGAPKVDAAGIDNDGSSDVAGSLIVTLPKETATRQKIFALEADQRKAAGDQATPDAGQRYLRFKLD